MDKYGTTGFALGISCEKCHGPGRKHMERERAKPSLPFSYLPGEPLAKYIDLPPPDLDAPIAAALLQQLYLVAMNVQR